jgi:hypothetical protein
MLDNFLVWCNTLLSTNKWQAEAEVICSNGVSQLIKIEARIVLGSGGRSRLNMLRPVFNKLAGDIESKLQNC